MDIKEEMEMCHKFLLRLYELRKEKPSEYPNGYDIGKELGLEEKDARTVMDSLAEAGKIRKMSRNYMVDIEPLGREDEEEYLIESLKGDKEDKQKIFRQLEDFSNKYNAEYYCVILTPVPGEKEIRVPGSFNKWIANRGETGIIIERVVEKEVLSKIPFEE